MLKVFVGYDPRQPLAYNVLQHSIQRHTNEHVAVMPLKLDGLPIKRRGLTEFTYSRFLVPYLSGYTYESVFMDADIIVRGDIAELFKCLDKTCSVQVMQEQARFEWPSVMLFNNYKCRNLTPEFIDDPKNGLLDLAWAEKVGELPKEWNNCVGYAEFDPDAKLYHFTQGIPCWYETQGNEADAVWAEEFAEMRKTCGWKELMGRSVHAKPTLERLINRLTTDIPNGPA